MEAESENQRKDTVTDRVEEGVNRRQMGDMEIETCRMGGGGQMRLVTGLDLTDMDSPVHMVFVCSKFA